MSQICLGKEHVLTVTNDGKMYTWGSNSNGQLGVPIKTTEKVVEFTSYAPESDGLQQEDGNDQASNDDQNSPLDKFTSKPMTQVVKTVKLNYAGLPQEIKGFKGRVESVVCGESNNFCVVKI